MHWSIEIKNAIKARISAPQLFHRNPTMINLINFKLLKAKARCMIRQAKRESWQTFSSAITPQTTTTTVWNSVKKIAGRSKPSGIKSLKLNNTVY